MMLHLEPHLYPGAIAYPNAYFSSGSGPYYLDNVYCSGSESSLLSCRRGYGIGVHNCRPGKAAGVKCGRCLMPITGRKFCLESIYFISITGMHVVILKESFDNLDI